MIPKARGSECSTLIEHKALNQALIIICYSLLELVDNLA